MKKSFLAIVLVISILINMIFITKYLSDKFKSHNRNDNTNKPYYELLEEVFTNCPRDTNSIVFLGNSITAAFRIEEYCPGLNIKNRGIPSNQTSDILRRLPDILRDKPRKLFLMIGVNDILQEVDSKTTLKNYRQIVSKIINDCPNTELYLQSILPVKKGVSNYLLSGRNRANQLIDTLNEEIRGMAIEFDASYIELNIPFKENNELNPLYSWDGIHINSRGYSLWKQLIEHFIITQVDDE